MLVHVSVGKRAWKLGISWPISKASTPHGQRCSGASCSSRVIRSMPSGPDPSAFSGSARYSLGSAAIDSAFT